MIYKGHSTCWLKTSCKSWASAAQTSPSLQVSRTEIVFNRIITHRLNTVGEGVLQATSTFQRSIYGYPASKIMILKFSGKMINFQQPDFCRDGIKSFLGIRSKTAPGKFNHDAEFGRISMEIGAAYLQESLSYPKSQKTVSLLFQYYHCFT